MISLLNDTDLRLLAGMTIPELKRLISTKTVRSALIFRRNIQMSLTSYSKKHPVRAGKLDQVHGAMIGICHQIEAAARDAFTLTYWRKMKAQYPNMTLTEKVSRKHQIKTDWEKLLRTFTY